jgi:hypothetical protein
MYYCAYAENLKNDVFPAVRLNHSRQKFPFMNFRISIQDFPMVDWQAESLPMAF